MSRTVVLVLDGDGAHEVFEVISVDARVAHVRSPLWFEIGEELRLRIEQDGTVTETTGRVRSHAGPADAKVTELELREATA